MKRILILLVGLAAGLNLLVTSCSEDFLEKNPQGQLSESVLSSVDGLEALLIGAYAMLDGNAGWDAGDMWRSTTTNWVFGNVYTDDAYKGTDVGDQPQINPIERYEHDASNAYFITKWSAMYDGISRCNDVLKILIEAEEKEAIEADLATQMRAEARFLRAFYHLELVKMFDFVPYVTEEAETDLLPNTVPSGAPVDANLPWSQQEFGGGDIPWESIEADIQYAYDNLDWDPRDGEVGRITRGAAAGFMAKVFMFQGKYLEAVPLLDAVINSGKYSLPESFHENFRISGDNNSESILQVQNTSNDGSGAGYNANYGDILNFPYTGGPGQCCGFHQPSQNLVNAFKTQNGLPYLEALGLDFNASGDDVISDQGLASSDAFTPDTRPLDPRLDWTVGRRGLPYLDWGLHPGRDWIRDQTYGGPYAAIKEVYYESDIGSGAHAGGWGGGLSANNHSLLRYADVLLMRAECAAQTDNFTDARTYVNEVRARMVDHPENWVKDDGGNNAANYDIALYGAGAPFDSRDNALEAVRFERRLELALEGHRFWDLKRYGGTKDYINNEYLPKESQLRTHLIGASFGDEDIRFPIPQTAIDRSEGTLSQNPGY